MAAHDDISWIRKTDKCIWWYLVYFSLFQTYRYTLLSLFSKIYRLRMNIIAGNIGYSTRRIL